MKPPGLNWQPLQLAFMPAASLNRWARSAGSPGQGPRRGHGEPRRLAPVPRRDPLIIDGTGRPYHM